MADGVGITVLDHGEALQEAYGHIAGFGEGELLADADAGAAIELVEADTVSCV